MSDDLFPNPNSAANRQEMERVVRDIEERTLVGLQGHFNQLVYLASLRDYNTGRYHRYGLETRYPAEAVDEGLHQCHARIFEELVGLPIEEQTADLSDFFDSVQETKRGWWLSGSG
jgi:hypothetical protein